MWGQVAPERLIAAVINGMEVQSWVREAESRAIELMARFKVIAGEEGRSIPIWRTGAQASAVMGQLWSGSLTATRIIKRITSPQSKRERQTANGKGRHEDNSPYRYGGRDDYRVLSRIFRAFKRFSKRSTSDCCLGFVFACVVVHWWNQRNMKETLEYETRITRLTVNKTNEPIFSELATHIQIEDEAAGEFISIRQYSDHPKAGVVNITAEEWPHIKAAIEQLLPTICNAWKKQSNTFSADGRTSSSPLLSSDGLAFGAGLWLRAEIEGGRGMSEIDTAAIVATVGAIAALVVIALFLRGCGRWVGTPSHASGAWKRPMTPSVIEIA
jgi:hypothetical protein